MPRDNRCMYMAHVRVCCSDCVGPVGMFIVYRPLLNIFFSMVYVCVRGGMDVAFSVCIVTR